MFHPTSFEMIASAPSRAMNFGRPRTRLGRNLLTAFETCLIMILGLVALDLAVSHWGLIENPALVRLLDLTGRDSIATLLSSILMFGVAGVLWAVWWAEGVAGTQRLGRFGWMFTALCFTYFAVTGSPVVYDNVVMLVQYTIGDVSLSGGVGQHMALPLIAEIGFGMLVFLWTQKAKKLKVEHVLIAFSLIAVIGVMVMLSRIPDLPGMLAMNGWTEADVIHLFASIQVVLKMIAMSILLVTFAGYLVQRTEGGHLGAKDEKYAWF